MDQIRLTKNGAWVSVERTFQGYFTVRVYTPVGHLHDKVTTDDYRAAMDYRRAFLAVARNL